MRFTVLITCFLVGILNLQGQTFNESDWTGIKFRNIGPSGMSGRVTSIDVDLNRPQRIFVGTASGGVWKSEDGGTSWKPIFDKNDCLSIGSIKINQNNPAEIWVGTGEGNPRNSLNTGNGIYKSIDGGRTWNKMGLDNTKTIHRIIIDRTNSDVVYAAAMGSPWGPNPERGVFKTIDGGQTWKKILYVNDETGAADMVVDPNNPNKIIVAMWEHSRKPWFFTSGGKGSGLYLTYDGGENWKRIKAKDGIPEGELGRIGIAISPSKPNIIYSLIEAKENGLYKSIDGGESWKLVSKKNIGNRPFYYSELYVDPLNENRIYNLYTYVSRSEDGGRTFEQIMNYGNNIHPDHHAFWIHPQDNQYIIGGNDGGLTISRDGGNNWQFINNIPVGQFYHINIDNDFPYNVYGGMQDNGSWIGPSAVLKRGGIRNSDFRELSFGDGFDVVPFRSDSRYGYSMSQQGYVSFYDRFTGHARFVRPLHPDSVDLRFNWNTAIAQDPFDDCGVYFGSQFVHHSMDCGESWDIISPDLTTNDATKQNYDNSGGLTFDATGAENHTTILCIAPSTFEKNTIWVGTDDGRLQQTLDGGNTWTDIYPKLHNAPKDGWIAQIVLSNINKHEAFVVINNYRQNDYQPYLYHTLDNGQSWQSLVTEDLTNFNLSIIQDPVYENLLFLGADNGLFFSLDKGQKWHHFKEKFPQVQVSKLKIHEGENDLVIGTFGRSIWILDNISFLRSWSKNDQIFEDSLKLFQPTTAFDLNYRSVDGMRFIGQGEFVGDNEMKSGASIRYWFNPDSIIISESTSKKYKAELVILDEQRDTVRHKEVTLKKGLNSFRWYLEKNGKKYPRRNEFKASKYPVHGRNVLPGNYSVYITYKNIKDSTNVVVKNDPRIDADINDLKLKYEALDEIEEVAFTAYESFEQIRSSRKTIKMVKELMTHQPDSIKNHFDSLHQKMETAMDSIEIFYFGEENTKGIKRSNNTLVSSLWSAERYVESSTSSPIGTASIAIKKAKAKVKKGIAKIQKFMLNQWSNYQNEMDNLDIILYKDD